MSFKTEVLSMLLVLAAVAAAGGDLRPCWRNLTPDARAKLAEYAKQAEGWKAHTERPQMLVRAQSRLLRRRTEEPFHQGPVVARAAMRPNAAWGLLRSFRVVYRALLPNMRVTSPQPFAPGGKGRFARVRARLLAATSLRSCARLLRNLRGSPSKASLSAAHCSPIGRLASGASAPVPPSALEAPPSVFPTAQA